MSIWNGTFLAGVAIGYVVLAVACRLRLKDTRPAYLPLRWIVTVYVAAVGAQLFAYLFDLHTSVFPPQSVPWFRYYLDPLFGPKTLYGAIVLLPVAVLAISAPWGDLDFRAGLDCWTPALFAVLGATRVGCFLEGCCYGIRTERWGISFPAGTPASRRHLEAGLIEAGEQSLPVVPTQLIEAFALVAICVWALWRLRDGHRKIFPGAVVAYSAFRLCLEFIRDDPDRNFLGFLSTSQWIALSILAAYVTWHYVWQRPAVPSRD